MIEEKGNSVLKWIFHTDDQKNKKLLRDEILFFPLYFSTLF